MNPVRFMATKSKFIPSTLGERQVPLVLEVLVDLPVEGEGPREEVDPSDDLDYQPLVVLHRQLNRFISNNTHTHSITSSHHHNLYIPLLLLINHMRSVSIVYRKQNHQPVREMQPASLVKRSVDDYYNKLIEKEKNRDRNNSEKNKALQRVKLRTSRSQRNSDQFNILETLSIAQIALRQPPEEKKEERKEEAKREKGIIVRKLDGCKTVLKGLNIPHSLLQDEDEENTQKNSHCKLKNLFISRSIENKDTVIALSANFIIDEHYFWQDEAVDELAAKFWKVLQSYAAIVWLCEREGTAKKLMKFCKANGLRFDAAYLIIPRKGRRSLTVSYQLIENDFAIRFHKSSSPLLIKDERKMIAINGLLVEQTKDLHYSCFYQAVPIIKNYRSVVHYVKVEMSDKGRLNSVIRLLSQ